MIWKAKEPAHRGSWNPDDPDEGGVLV